ncbi:MAG: cysteine--tRNA ligase, partial [Actinomycetia bacterium]|nr:cysteine--tRNA ligase [Actinomycetes bacterium]
EKMSKSLGNALLVSELTQLVRPIELRYYLGAAHYRSVIEFSEAALQEAAAGFRRIESFILRATDLVGAGGLGNVSQEFASAMDDDLGVPAAVAALHGAVTDGNSALAAGDRDAVVQALASVRAMARVLGVDPIDPIWSEAGSDDEAPVAALSVLVDRLLADREQARAEKDFTTADNIRAALGEAGVEIEDGAAGSRWSLAR